MERFAHLFLDVLDEPLCPGGLAQRLAVCLLLLAEICRQILTRIVEAIRSNNPNLSPEFFPAAPATRILRNSADSLFLSHHRLSRLHSAGNHANESS